MCPYLRKSKYDRSSVKKCEQRTRNGNKTYVFLGESFSIEG